MLKGLCTRSYQLPIATFNAITRSVHAKHQSWLDDNETISQLWGAPEEDWVAVGICPLALPKVWLVAGGFVCGARGNDIILSSTENF